MKSEIDILILRASRNKEKAASIDRSMVEIIKEKINLNLQEKLEDLWHNECKKEEEKSKKQPFYDNMRKHTVTTYSRREFQICHRRRIKTPSLQNEAHFKNLMQL